MDECGHSMFDVEEDDTRRHRGYYTRVHNENNDYILHQTTNVREQGSMYNNDSEFRVELY